MTPAYPFTLTPHRSLPRNTSGRDFFVGDIHGHYSHLLEQLAAVDFDARHDRLIAVGDLIDRGSENLEVLALLDQPWFHSVLGNHEIMMLEWVLGDAPHYYRMQVLNGGDWLGTVDDDTLRRHAETLVQKCPLALTIDTASGCVGVSHTDPLLADWQNMQTFSLDDFNAELASLWSRQRYHHARMQHPQDPIAHVDYVVCGHVACEQPVWAANQVFIDTKYRGGALTVQPLEQLLTLKQA